MATQKTDNLQDQLSKPMVGVFTVPFYNVISGAVKTPTTSWNTDHKLNYK